MNRLYLNDLKDMLENDVKNYLVEAYKADENEVDKYDILIGCEQEWAYEGYSWYLLRNKISNELFEVNGAHCSCYGYEGQFEPQLITVEYLKSTHFNSVVFSNHPDNKIKVLNFIDNNFIN